MDSKDRSTLPRRLWGRLAAASTTCILAATLALPAAAQAFKPETVASGLDHPWAVAFLPQGRFLVTERPGRMRVVSAQGALGAPLAGLPEVAAGGQGGLLDVVLDSGFATNRTLYFCFSEPGPGRTNSTAMARARLSDDERRLEDVRVIFSQKPKFASSGHFGCRIVEARDGTLFLTLGERMRRAEDSQTLDNHHGKIVRVGKDGSVPRDNPFTSRAGALPEIWSYGHRNAQGATLGPDGRVWMHEHGPQGGDEINVPQPGRNYGWPVITYGEQYGGGKVGEGLTERAGMEQPLHQWTPSIAPSGMVFLSSDRYGADAKGDLFVGSLKFGYLGRVEFTNGKVAREHKLLQGIGRVRDVRQGPDGLLYLVTDEGNGKLVRVMP
ncbi:MAG TPA: PQQ-dependent sugar dehydrogenase [Ramlibacter sp.]|jgi:glucose/arabinose dehydrogenase|nr:PQQ-dependent sugar dehydrogenase [Ramlibacter sp.]